MLAGTGSAFADHRDDAGMMVRAKVLSSTPVYDTVSDPHRECWTESGYETRNYRNNNTGGSIIGAIAGGLLGSTVGKGNGRIAAAAVGAGTGAVIGGNWNDGDRQETRPVDVQRCRTVDRPHQVVSGYDVRYRYEGREFATRLPYDPGNWLNLNVNVSVADDQRGGRWNQGRYDSNDD
jgi:uncharacterized protein YcfJ